MKTAQVIRRLGFQDWGGTETVVWNTSMELQRAGIQTEILATRVMKTLPFENTDGLSIRRFPCFYPYFPMTSSRRDALDRKGGNPFCFSLERYLKKNNFDLIHCHNLGRLAELCARVSLGKNIPLILSLHGGCFNVPESEMAELIRPYRHTVSYGGALERLFGWKMDPIARASCIVCVGADEVDELKKHYPGKRVEYMPNGVRPERFDRENPFDWRKELNLSPDTRLLLNVSRIDYQKNQKLLVKLVSELKLRGDKVHLLLIGPLTAEWYAEELHRMIRNHGLSADVTVVPGLPPSDDRLTGAYLSADRFLLPSLHEPFGIVLLEAWSAGLPVIASRVGGPAHIVTDGKTGFLFQSDSIQSLMDAYDACSADGENAGKAGQCEVREKYTWTKAAERLQKLYAEVTCEQRSVRQ